MREGPAQLLERIPAHAVEAGDVALAHLGELFKCQQPVLASARRAGAASRSRGIGVGSEVMPIMTGAIGEIHRSALRQFPVYRVAQ